MRETITLGSVVSKCQQRSAALDSFIIELSEEWDYEPAKHACKHVYSICGSSCVHVRDVGAQQVIGLKVSGQRWVSITKNEKGAVVTKNLPPYDRATQFQLKPRPELPQPMGGYKGQSVGDLVRNPVYFPFTSPIYQRRNILLKKHGADHQYWAGELKRRSQNETLSLRFSALDPDLIVEAKICRNRKDDDSFVSADTWIVEETTTAEDGSLVPKCVKKSYDSRGQDLPDTTWKLTFDAIRIGEVDEASFEIDTYVPHLGILLTNRGLTLRSCLGVISVLVAESGLTEPLDDYREAVFTLPGIGKQRAVFFLLPDKNSDKVNDLKPTTEWDVPVRWDDNTMLFVPTLEDGHILSALQYIIGKRTCMRRL